MSTPNQMSRPTEPSWEQAEFVLQPDSPGADRAATERAENLRRVRRVSNWSLAALLVGVGATSAVLAHAIPGHTASAGYISSTQGGGLVGAGVGSGLAPSLSGPVAVTSGSQVAPASAGTTSGGTTSQARGAVAGGSPQGDW